MSIYTFKNWRWGVGSCHPSSPSGYAYVSYWYVDIKCRYRPQICD